MFYKIMIFVFGFIILFISEILIKYTGNNLTQDFIIIVFPIIIFLSVYLFILTKNYRSWKFTLNISLKILLNYY